MIPEQNVQHLMLDHQVVEAIRKKQFHIWTVKTIDEGIELLTGVPAGVCRADGTYPENSVHGRAMRKLRKWIDKTAELAQGKIDNVSKEKKS